MNILDTILDARNDAAVTRAGSQAGLAPDQTAAALSVLVPALAAGFQRNMQSQDGLQRLMTALTAGNHGWYLDNPASLTDPSAVQEGNGILGHLLGNKEVSREVATRAAAQTGLSDAALKRLLPLAATMMMAAFARQSRRGASLPRTNGSSAAIAAMLMPLLDHNRDGSIADDVSSMIGRVAKP